MFLGDCSKLLPLVGVTPMVIEEETCPRMSIWPTWTKSSWRLLGYRTSLSNILSSVDFPLMTFWSFWMVLKFLMPFIWTSELSTYEVDGARPYSIRELFFYCIGFCCVLGEWCSDGRFRACGLACSVGSIDTFLL